MKQRLQLVTVMALGLILVWAHSWGRSNEEAPSPEAAPHTAAFPLPGTSLLTESITDDFRETQRQQIISYFVSQITATPAKRDRLWCPDFPSPAAYQQSLRRHRAHLREMLGFREHLRSQVEFKPLAGGKNLRASEVLMRTESGFTARGLVFFPCSGKCAGAVIAIPPADITAADFAAGKEGQAAAWLRELLVHDVAVAILMAIPRTSDHPICVAAGGRDRRHVLWRAGFIVGRTLVALEAEQALLLRAYLAGQPEMAGKCVALMGQGDGGMTALFAGAVDDNFASVASIDNFQQRENAWQEPADRVIYGQLNEFGDAELAALIAPRPLLIGTTDGSIASDSVRRELSRATRYFHGLKADHKLVNLGTNPDGLSVAAEKLTEELGGAAVSHEAGLSFRIPSLQSRGSNDEHFESWFAYLNTLIAASGEVRKQHWRLTATPVVERAGKARQLRTELSGLVGNINPQWPLNARTRLIAENDKFLGYDVVLNALPGVEVYGQLLVPRAVAGRVRERRPVVICQHGFDGQPKYLTGIGEDLEGNEHFYHRFGQRLAERGYVVFAPYLTVPAVNTGSAQANRADLVNPLVRMAASIGLMRTSIELTKLHRVLDFLELLPFVDRGHIGYYGLSYGGYSALWMPPLEPRLSLSFSDSQ